MEAIAKNCFESRARAATSALPIEFIVKLCTCELGNRVLISLRYTSIVVYRT